MGTVCDAAVDAALAITRESPAQADCAKQGLAAAFSDLDAEVIDEAFAGAVRLLDAAEGLAYDSWRSDGDPRKLSEDEARQRLHRRCPGFEGRSYDKALSHGRRVTGH